MVVYRTGALPRIASLRERLESFASADNRYLDSAALTQGLFARTRQRAHSGLAVQSGALPLDPPVSNERRAERVAVSQTWRRSGSARVGGRPAVSGNAVLSIRRSRRFDQMRSDSEASSSIIRLGVARVRTLIDRIQAAPKRAWPPGRPRDGHRAYSLHSEGLPGRIRGLPVYAFARMQARNVPSADPTHVTTTPPTVLKSLGIDRRSSPPERAPRSALFVRPS